jgi:CHASE3 domain sensor protein
VSPLGRRPPRTVTYAGFGLAIALLGIAGTVSWRTQQAYQDGVEWTKHSYDVIDVAQQLSFALLQAEAGGRGYALSGLPGLKTEAERNIRMIPVLFDSLHLLVNDNPLQHARLDSLSMVLGTRIELLDRLMVLRDSQGRISPEMSSLVAQGEQQSGRIRRGLRLFSNEERGYLELREAATAERGLIALYTVAAALILALLILGAATSVTLQELTERQRAEEALQVEAERQLMQVLEGLVGELADGVLADRGKEHVAQLLEAGVDDVADDISKHQNHGNSQAQDKGVVAIRSAIEAVDDALIGKGDEGGGDL